MPLDLESITELPDWVQPDEVFTVREFVEILTSKEHAEREGSDKFYQGSYYIAFYDVDKRKLCSFVTTRILKEIVAIVKDGKIAEVGKKPPKTGNKERDQFLMRPVSVFSNSVQTKLKK